MNSDKIIFLKTTVPDFLMDLKPSTKAEWGLMSLQNMVEHLVIGLKISNGKIKVNLHTSKDQLPAYLKFLASDKEFPPNTKNPVMGEVPPPVHYPDLYTAVNKLIIEIDDFFKFFEDDQEKKTLHPVFGELNFEGWMQLHYKHFLHHIKQFGFLK